VLELALVIGLKLTKDSEYDDQTKFINHANNYKEKKIPLFL
jgi:hypothetical protein